MPVTRIKNNQITDLTVNAASKLQDYTVTATKIANNLTYGSDLTITGNLTVQGNTTTIDTVNVVVEDPLILLAAAQTGAPTLDIGFIGKRGTSDNITFVWDESQGMFVAAFTSSEVTNTTVNINSYASLKTLDSTVTGNLGVTGTTSLTGNVSLANVAFATASTIDAGNNRIGNVADPIANSDVATKAYVDNQSASGFTIEDDTANTTVVSGGDTLQLLGTTNEVTVEITATDQITFGLPNDVTVTGNLSANKITSTTSVNGATGEFSGNVLAGNVNSNAAVTGVTVTASGNLNGNNAVITNDVSTTTVTASGNVLAGNVNSNAAVTGVTITASGNLNGNNAVITNDVSATTGSFSGNVLAGNVNSNAAVTGVTVTASGNLNGNNAVITNDVSAVTGTFSGNVLAANVNSNAAVTGVTITASGNLNGNNAVITNDISATTGTFSGNVSANNASITNGVTATNITATANVNGGNINTNSIVGTEITITSIGNLLIDTTANVDFGGAVLQDIGTPVNPSDAATKQYVDEVAQGLDVKASVVYATAAALPAYTYNNGTAGVGATITANANGALSVDGNTPAVNDRILVKNEGGANQPYNGIYVVTTVGDGATPFVLTRSTDFDNGSPSGEIPGAFTFVEAGNTNADTGWVCTTNQPVTVGTTNIIWTQFSGAGAYTAGNGISLIGTQFNVNVDGDTTWINLSNEVAVKPNANLVTPNIGNAIGNSLTLSGNGLLAATTVEASGNVLAGNVNSNAAVTGITITASGNLNGNNAVITNDVSAATATVTGNVLAGNVNSNAAVTGVTITASGNLNGNNAVITNDVSATTGTFSGNVLAGNVNSNAAVTGVTITASGNLNGNNAVITNDVSAVTGTFSGNVLAANVNSNAAVTGVTITASGNLEANNAVITNDIFGANVAITGNVRAGNFNANSAVHAVTLNASGNVIAGNAEIINGIYAVFGDFTGNVTADKFIGNIDAGGSNTQIQFNDTGDVLAGSPGFTFDKTSNLVVSSGNIDAANFNTAGIGRFGNIAITSDTINGFAGIININGAGDNTDFAVNGDTTANLLFVDAGTETVSIGSSTQTTGAALAVNTTNSILVPVGNTAQRPVTPVTGMVRFNTTTNYLEFYDNNSWETAGSTFTVIANDTFNGDGSTVAFILSQAATTASVIVSINGVVQLPTTAYGVTGTTLTFTEAPVAGDVIDVRILTTTTTVTSLSGTGGGLIEGSAVTAGFDVTGNLLPAANVTYDLGSDSFAWRDLYLSGSTIRLGNIKLSAVNGALAVTTAANVPTTIDTPSIQNGTSNVVVTNNGNINMSVGGSANVMTVTTSGTVVNGDLTVTGNATLSGNIVADKISNGTTSIEIQTANGNANISVGGVSNVVVFTTTAVNVTGDMTVSGNVTAQDVNSLSDMVLKTNIQPLSGVDSIINNLNGVEYDWKNGSGHSYGFLAQEVEKVLPSAVKTNENGLKSINYMMIIPFLVETIKQMGNEIQDLKKTVQKRRAKK